jgi:hypothetical protein
MKLIDKRGSLGLVVEHDNSNVHLILDRYRVDDDGHICVTRPMPILELRYAVELLKAQLDGLVASALGDGHVH